MNNYLIIFNFIWKFLPLTFAYYVFVITSVARISLYTIANVQRGRFATRNMCPGWYQTTPKRNIREIILLQTGQLYVHRLYSWFIFNFTQTHISFRNSWYKSRDIFLVVNLNFRALKVGKNISHTPILQHLYSISKGAANCSTFWR